MINAKDLYFAFLMFMLNAKLKIQGCVFFFLPFFSKEGVEIENDGWPVPY
jgi:hypothetical protein